MEHTHDLHDILEAQDPTYDLDGITWQDAPAASAFALVKMHLWTMGEIHRTLAEVGKETRADLDRIGDRPLELGDIGPIYAAFVARWTRWIEWYADTLFRLIGQAAAVKYAPAALAHDAIILPFKPEADLEEVVRPPITSPDMGALELVNYVRRETMAPRVYDQTGLSGRIWRLDNQTRSQINATLNQAVANQWTPWQTAEAVEGFLGFGADCPRWTRARISATNPVLIAQGDRTGLVSGGACRSQGVAYNALRLSRTELQYAANLMTQELHRLSPWVEAERVNLSPQHPRPDICDDVAGGGETGDGIYPIGDISLPLHPHCLCYFTAELIDPRQFNRLMRDYLRAGAGGSSRWPSMGGWASFVGGSLFVGLATTYTANVMANWLQGSPEELDQQVYEEDLE